MLAQALPVPDQGDGPAPTALIQPVSANQPVRARETERQSQSEIQSQPETEPESKWLSPSL